MKKILIIDDCDDCKHFDREYPWWEHTCKKLDRPIELSRDGYVIPDDCPLDEAVEVTGRPIEIDISSLKAGRQASAG